MGIRNSVQLIKSNGILVINLKLKPEINQMGVADLNSPKECYQKIIQFWFK